jgi:hypothetical protein
MDRAKRDLSRFRAAGFGNARVWIDWPEDRSPGCRALDEDGNWIEDVAKRLDEYMLYGLTIGMSFDLTMRAAAYKAVKKSAEGYDISAHKRAVRNVLARWGSRRRSASSTWRTKPRCAVLATTARLTPGTSRRGGSKN